MANIQIFEFEFKFEFFLLTEIDKNRQASHKSNYHELSSLYNGQY